MCEMEKEKRMKEKRKRPVLIAVSGLPGSGKSTLSEYIAKETGISLICKDSVKEALFDTIGFQNRAEKTKLNNAALKIIFYIAEQVLKAGNSLILENNFESNAYEYFKQLEEKCEVTFVTVLVCGDMKTIYNRYVKRNEDPTRHRGHILSTCYPEREDTIGKIPIPISYEEFCDSFSKRGMTDFHVGDVIELDVTDFDKVDYKAICDSINFLL